MVLDRVHRVACATDMVQSQSWEPVPVEAAVKTGKCGWDIVQVLLSAAPAENPQDKVRNTSQRNIAHMLSLEECPDVRHPFYHLHGLP